MVCVWGERERGRGEGEFLGEGGLGIGKGIEKNVQSRPINTLRRNDPILLPNSLSCRPKLRKPDHDLVIRQTGVLGRGLVRVQEHVDGHVGVYRVGEEFGFGCCGGGGVTYAVGPVGGEGDGLDGREEVWHVGEDLDVGEGVDGLRCWTGWVGPCYGEFGGRGGGGVGSVVEGCYLGGD